MESLVVNVGRKCLELLAASGSATKSVDLLLVADQVLRMISNCLRYESVRAKYLGGRHYAG